MQTPWNHTALNPLVCKILVGTVALGFLAVLVFHQPWFPVEISHAETGVLVAEPQSTSPTARGNERDASETATPDGKPILLPLVQSPKKNSFKNLGPSRFRQTAEVSFGPENFSSERRVPTYAEQIAPLLRKHCLHCHDEGKWDFTDPNRVITAAERIAEVTASRQMPPWNAKADVGTFENESRLSEAEIALIQNWVQTGATRGNFALSEKGGGWKLGKPSVAYQLPEPFEVPASESGLQWNFVIPTGVKRELFLTGWELRPGNKALVKRMVLSYDVTGTARKNDQKTPETGFPTAKQTPIPANRILGEWTPGMPAWPLPKGSAYPIPAGADLVLTVDYASTSKPALDPWAMGLFLTRSAPKHRLGRIEVAMTQTPSREGYRLPTDAIVFSITPEAMRQDCGLLALARTPAGQVIPLLEIENREPRWKNRYIFSKPIPLPKDSRLVIEMTESERDKHAPTAAAGVCVFEVATPHPAHIELLLQHNASARDGF